MKHLATIFLTILIFSGTGAAQNLPEYLPGKLVIKFDSEPVLARKAVKLGADPKEQVKEYIDSHGLRNFRPVLQQASPQSMGGILAKRDITESPREILDDLYRTWYVDYASGTDPITLSSRLSSMPGVVYAEPRYVYYTQYEPGDPLFGTPGQDFFEHQNFPEAWAVSRSSSDVVIAIVDSGVYYDHPDLANKLYVRSDAGPSAASLYFEAVEDDHIGWDFWESGDVFAGEEPVQSNDPTARWSTHGTHVAGIAAAEPDNGIGIVGTGYHARFMPVKVGGTLQYPNALPYGAEGILYAALNGADIINCSFGSPSRSLHLEDAVNTATAMGALVVASAGNERNDRPFYPASFRNVLSVGSVESDQNIRSDFSSFGFETDVFATGRRLLSTGFEYDRVENTWITTPDSLGYVFSTGTSMSAPVVSGLAALIKHQYPDWTPRRIAYQIRNTARSIEDNHGSQFALRLGRGVIDAYAALTKPMPGLEIIDIQFLNEEGNSLNVGDQGIANITLTNHGVQTSPSVSIASLTDRVSILSGSSAISMATEDTLSIELGIQIDDNYDLSESLFFHLKFEDQQAGYDDFAIREHETLMYEVMETGALAMSFSNDGTIGFRDALGGSEGIGFIPRDGVNQLFEGGLMIHVETRDSAWVVNQVRAKDTITRHFAPVQNIASRIPTIHADSEKTAAFTSSLHPAVTDLHVRLETFAFEDEEVNQSVFVRYSVDNKSSTDYHNIHVGLFNDWDVGTYSNNHVNFREADSLMYVFDGQNEDQPFTAVAHMGVISSAFAIDNESEMTLARAETREDSLRFGIYYNVNNPAVFDGFTQEEKQLALTSGLERISAANTDISVVTGTGPFLLEPDASVTVGFIYAYGKDLDDLAGQVASARERKLFAVSAPGIYRLEGGPVVIPETTVLHQNYPNPFNQTTNIHYELSDAGPVEVRIYDVLGRHVTTVIDGWQNGGPHIIPFDARGLASGLYLITLRTENGLGTRTMSLVK